MKERSGSTLRQFKQKDAISFGKGYSPAASNGEERSNSSLIKNLAATFPQLFFGA